MPSIKKSKISHSRLNGQRNTKTNIMKGGKSVSNRIAELEKRTINRKFSAKSMEGIHQFGSLMNNRTDAERNKNNEDRFISQIGRPRTGNVEIHKMVEKKRMKKPVHGNQDYNEYIGYNNADDTWQDQFIERADTYLTKDNNRTKSRYESLMNARRKINSNLSRTRSTLEEAYRNKYKSGWSAPNRNNTFDPLYNFSKEQMEYIRDHPAQWIKYVQDVIQPATFRDGTRKRLVKEFFEKQNLGTEFKLANISHRKNNRISQGKRDFNRH